MEQLMCNLLRKSQTCMLGSETFACTLLFKTTRFLFISASLLPVVSSAASPWEYAEEETRQWYYQAGIGVEYEPTYAGSDKYSTEPGLALSATYVSSARHRYFLSLGEMGAHFQLNPNTVFSSVLEYEPGRENSDDSTLTGLNEIEDTVELQLALNRRWGDYLAAVAMQYDVLDRGKGLVWFAGVGRQFNWSDNWNTTLKLDVSGGDATHMQTEFGINASEAARNGLSAYSPGSGLKSTSLTLDNSYHFNKHWSLNGELSVESYFSKAANSPLIAEEGRDLTAELALSLQYDF